jgi:hypothetical protein
MILCRAIGLNSGDAETVADIYFGITRVEAKSWVSYTNPAQIPETRAGVIALLKKHGLVESDIDRVAIESSAEALTALENLAFRHEVRRESIFRELERRREKRSAQQQAADHARLNGKVRALAKDLPEETSPSTSPRFSCHRRMAQLVAREAAYRESPEARGLARVYELSLNNICGKLIKSWRSAFHPRRPCPTTILTKMSTTRSTGPMLSRSPTDWTKAIRTCRRRSV